MTPGLRTCCWVLAVAPYERRATQYSSRLIAFPERFGRKEADSSKTVRYKTLCPRLSHQYRRETYNSVQQWLQDARTLASPDVALVLVGNKSDLEEDREVTFLEASRCASQARVPILLLTLFVYACPRRFCSLFFFRLACKAQSSPCSHSLLF